MYKVSDRCPFCRQKVKGPFSLIAPNMKSMFKLRYNKVHPRCVVKRVKITREVLGMVDAYGGAFGEADRELINSIGKGGTAVLHRNLSYLWVKLPPWEQERALTGKLLVSWTPAESLTGKVVMGTSPKRTLYGAFFGMAWMIMLDLVFTYLIISETAPSLTVLFYPILAFCIGATLFLFLSFRSLTKLIFMLENQPLPPGLKGQPRDNTKK